MRCPPDYSKLPPNPNVDIVYVLDPLIATGGTAVAAMNMIVDWGIPRTFLLLSDDLQTIDRAVY